MSRRNVSHVSNSKAASIAFRQNELFNADIYFRPRSLPALLEIEILREEIISIPTSLRHAENHSEISIAIGQLATEEREIYEKALIRCLSVKEGDVESCALQHERVWMREVNEPTLALFLNAKRSRLLSSTEDYLWALGRELVSSQSAESLNDPKPDIAFGLQPLGSSDFTLSDRHTWPAFSKKALETMKNFSSFSLTYSPSERQDIVYPAIIYEAKSDSNPILWAENQAAVGVARALGLLSDLARLAQWGSIPPVFAITSAGAAWQAHIAYVAHNGSIVRNNSALVATPVCYTELIAHFPSQQNLVPLLDKKLALENFGERFRLQLILHRIYRWLLGSFKNAVQAQLDRVWASYLEHISSALRSSASINNASLTLLP